MKKSLIDKIYIMDKLDEQAVAVFGFCGSRFVEPVEQGAQSAKSGSAPVEPKGASYGNNNESDLYVAEDGSVAFYDLNKKFVCMVRAMNGFELDRDSSWPTHVTYILKADEDIEYTVWNIGDHTKDIFSGKFAEEHPDLVSARNWSGR